MSYWIYLIIAGIAEVGFTTFLKLSEQFTKLLPSIAFVIFSAISFYFMSKSMKGIAMPVVYAVWSGIGIAGITIVDIVFLGEPINILKILLILVVLVCIIGLKLA